MSHAVNAANVAYQEPAHGQLDAYTKHRNGSNLASSLSPTGHPRQETPYAPKTLAISSEDSDQFTVNHLNIFS